MAANFSDFTLKWTRSLPPPLTPLSNALFPLYGRCYACGNFIGRKDMFVTFEGHVYCNQQRAVIDGYRVLWQWSPLLGRPIIFYPSPEATGEASRVANMRRRHGVWSYSRK